MQRRRRRLRAVRLGAGVEDVLSECPRRGPDATNHVGEMCAKALYQVQALSCSDSKIRHTLQMAADEEAEHMAWTERRIRVLGGQKILPNPLWYVGAPLLGFSAGRLGDALSLGFLAETERQV